MRYENKKLSKMVDELSTYCLERNVHKIKIELTNQPDRFLIELYAEGVKMTASELQNLKNILSSHREVEMEEYYWSLAGQGHQSEELGLVASMTDSAEIDLSETNLSIQLGRLKK